MTLIAFSIPYFHRKRVASQKSAARPARYFSSPVFGAVSDPRDRSSINTIYDYAGRIININRP
jgi:hypothetical protein